MQKWAKMFQFARHQKPGNRRFSLLAHRPRHAFARIATLVERSLFALRPLGEGDWRDARSAYEDFAFAEGWRG